MLYTRVCLQLVILVSYITSFQIFAKMKLYTAWMVLTFLVINLSDLTQGGDEGIDILWVHSQVCYLFNGWRWSEGQFRLAINAVASALDSEQKFLVWTLSRCYRVANCFLCLTRLLLSSCLCLTRPWFIRKVDNTIHEINRYLLDCAIRYAVTNPLDNEVSVG